HGVIAIERPPGTQEGGPLDTVTFIDSGIELLEIAEEARQTDIVENPANGPRPGLKAAEGRSHGLGLPGDIPGLTEGQERRDQLAAMRTHPGQEIGMAKARALPGAGGLGIQPNPVASAW